MKKRKYKNKGKLHRNVCKRKKNYQIILDSFMFNFKSFSIKKFNTAIENVDLNEFIISAENAIKELKK